MLTKEKTLRQQLAACHHIIHYQGWDDLLGTHLSVRIPDTDTILITPLNVPFEQVCASNLIKCDFDGSIMGESKMGLMPQAKNIHGAIYKASDHIMSVMHTHSMNGVAVASLDCGLLFIHQQSLRFYNDIAYHHYNGLALENEGEEMVKSLGDKSVLIARNHGLVATGNSIAQALYRLYYLEVACEIQVKALSTGQKLIEIPHDICEKTAKQFQSIQTTEFELQALMNRVSGKSKVDFRA